MPFVRALLRAELSLLVSSAGGAAVIALTCPQRSNAWRLARCGRLTASRAHDILARGRRDEESRTRAGYRRQLVVEQLTGIPYQDAYVSGPMRRGRVQEPAARAAYAEHTGQVVDTSGFLIHEELMAGCSLDGHVGAFEGVVEIKAPNTLTHLRYLATRSVPARYRAQMTHHLWITGARWCDFVSYDDRMPRAARLVIIRFWREELDVDGYDRAARRFLEEVRAQVVPLEVLPPVAFFQAAPIDVARHVLAACVHAVDGRRRERPAPMAPRPMPAWQPRLMPEFRS